MMRLIGGHERQTARQCRSAAKPLPRRRSTTSNIAPPVRDAPGPWPAAWPAAWYAQETKPRELFAEMQLLRAGTQ